MTPVQAASQLLLLITHYNINIIFNIVNTIDMLYAVYNLFIRVHIKIELGIIHLNISRLSRKILLICLSMNLFHKINALYSVCCLSDK